MANEETRRTWTDTAAGWVEQESLFDATFAPVTAAVLAAADLRAGQRVLDVGCGSGTLLAAADAVGAEAVGVDVSPAMVEAARRRVPAAEVLLADAQSTDLLAAAPGRPFDRVVSRFGVMFFDDPVTAFTTVRAATADNGRLAFACWRTYEENPIFWHGQQVLTTALGEDPAPLQPGTPGPMGFADPDHVRAVLGGAGWREVDVAPLDVTLDYGTDGTDGVENRLAIILATTTGRRALTELAPVLGPERWDALVDEVRTFLRTQLTEDAVRLPGACWLVTARA
ncbi:MAG: class SAM-dependent methyltransferase [Nocardioides sp.]|nr:class SAM-dependent methyltransferase [Nocardioides sp.]